MTRLLVESGADHRRAGGKGMTPLHVAAKNGRIEAIHYLLDLGHKIDARDKLEVTPLILALLMGQDKAAMLLIESGADPGAIDIGRRNALHAAIERCSVDTVSLLLKKGCDINLVSDAGYTPLHCAVNSKRADMVKLLLEHRADPKISRRETCLTDACRIDNADIARMLIGAGADVNRVDGRGEVPLIIAAEKGNREIV